jgi:hypothetical protein
MSEARLEGRWALVTGASSGIGADIARELGRRRVNLVLTARRRDRLDHLADELRATGVEVEVIEQDLAAPDAGGRLFERVEALGRPVDVLVNNAGFGLQGRFLELPWERQAEMLRVDIETLTRLSWLFGRAMAGRGFGRILQVASIGAFQPSPCYAAYAASKAYVLNFSQAMHHELRGSGVSVTTLCPGATATEFTEVAGAGPFKGLFRLLLMTPAQVAVVGVRAMERGRALAIPGLFNRVNASLMARLPRGLSTWIAARALG